MSASRKTRECDVRGVARDTRTGRDANGAERGRREDAARVQQALPADAVPARAPVAEAGPEPDDEAARGEARDVGVGDGLEGLGVDVGHEHARHCDNVEFCN